MLPIAHPKTHVANIDDSALVTVGSGIISERVGGSGGNRRSTTVLKPTGTGETTVATRGATEAAASSEATAKASATTEASTTHRTAKAATTAKATTKAATTTEAGATTSEPVFANFKGTTLPIVSVELRNGVARIIRRLKSNDTGALGASGRVGVHIGTDHGTLLGCNTESRSIHLTLEKSRNPSPKIRTYLLNGTDPSSLASQR